MPTVDRMGARVLVAEDDEKQAELLRRYLLSEGYEVSIARDGPDALAQARARQPELLILDVMMPAMDGLQVCHALRLDYSFPVLMLTARSAEDDLLTGLDLGADDYMTKPYSPRELMARVRPLLRRTQQQAAAPDALILRVGGLSVDPVRQDGHRDQRSWARDRVHHPAAVGPGVKRNGRGLLSAASVPHDRILAFTPCGR